MEKQGFIRVESGQIDSKGIAASVFNNINRLIDLSALYRLDRAFILQYRSVSFQRCRVLF